jgi:hypothetical protein
MIWISILFIIVALPVVSSRGWLYRGLWFAFMLICVIVGILFFFTIGEIASQEKTSNAISATSVAVNITLLSFATAFGCLLAGCTFRKKVTTDGTTTPKRA